MTLRIPLAISTCPNDTFAFHGILTGKVRTRGIEFDVSLMDIDELNRGLFAGRFGVAKASFHAALLLSDHMVVLPAGSALGFGVGPVLLASRHLDLESLPRDELKGLHILSPGEQTTAHLLWRLFHQGHGWVTHVTFSDIMPSLQRSEADLGICIHEGRFTYEQAGLVQIEDLGKTWEESTGAPLPLGGILARRDLGADTLDRVSRLLGDSILYGLENRDETVETMARYAQDMDEEVMFGHVDLYVNEWTHDLGVTGRMALAALAEHARRSGLVPGGVQLLEVYAPEAEISVE